MIKLPDRVFDLAVLLILAPVILLGLLVGATLVLITDGRPVFYLSRRMKAMDQGFSLLKLRTMKPATSSGGVTGGDKECRVSNIGQFLRRTRLDELPQAWNVLRGDIRLVGPRPPLPEYVSRFPEIYRQVLRTRPGITGLATLTFKDTEARLLKNCHTAAQTDAIYVRRCLPRKAALDLIYQRNKSIRFDLWLIWSTFRGLLPKRPRP